MTFGEFRMIRRAADADGVLAFFQVSIGEQNQAGVIQLCPVTDNDLISQKYLYLHLARWVVRGDDENVGYIIRTVDSSLGDDGR
jgi:hypothetical protein